MAHESLLMKPGYPGQLLVPFANRSKPVLKVGLAKRCSQSLPEFLHFTAAFIIDAQSLGILVLIEHGHVLPAPPTPEHLHVISFLANGPG
jgi:hypothetical protein